jgi:hypothetical protein
MPAPGDDLIAMRIRGVAFRLWRSVLVKEKDKEGWKDLQKTRHSDANVYKKGLKLLKKQGFLAKLKADCHDIVNTADAGPSQPNPAHPKAAKTSTMSSADTASTQSTPDRSDSLPKRARPGNTTAARPELNVADDAQSASDRSYSPPEFILPKQTIPVHTPRAHARRESVVIDLSDQPKSLLKFERPERTSAAHPDSRDVARPQHTLNQAQSSSCSSEHITVAHPKLEDDARIQSTSGHLSSTSSKLSLPVPTSVAHPRSKDDASTPERSSSPLVPAASQHMSITHPIPKVFVNPKSNVHPHCTPPFPR